MEPENHVVAQLKAIRAGIDTMREDLGDRLDGLTAEVRGNGKRLQSVEGHMELVAGEVTNIQLHLEWLRAQIGAASTQATVADTSRARLEARMDDVIRRLEELEAKA